MKLSLIASVSAFSTDYASSSYDDLDAPANFTCGETITSSQGIVSPSDEYGFYYNDLNCVWNIQLPSSVTSFQVIAHRFVVEDCGSICDCDYLTVDDGLNGTQSYCAWDQSRRRRASEKDGLQGRAWEMPVNPIDNGFSTPQHITGNTGTIKFVTDGSVTMRGFQICILADGDDYDTSCPFPPKTPATLSPADAWGQIVAAATDLATEVNDFYAALPGLGPNSVLASKKVARFNAFFAKMNTLNSLSSADACTYPAGSNDHATFVSPVDSADACEELQGLFASLSSFTDSYVCMPNAEYDPAKLNRLIQRQRKMIVTRKLKQMKCGNN